MLVRIMYGNGGFDMVRNDILNILIANQQAGKTRRACGWVDVERAPVRAALVGA